MDDLDPGRPGLEPAGHVRVRGEHDRGPTSGEVDGAAVGAGQRRQGGGVGVLGDGVGAGGEVGAGDAVGQGGVGVVVEGEGAAAGAEAAGEADVGAVGGGGVDDDGDGAAAGGGHRGGWADRERRGGGGAGGQQGEEAATGHGATTATGKVRGDVVPSPSWPPFAPQQRTSLDARSAQAWS